MRIPDARNIVRLVAVRTPRGRSRGSGVPIDSLRRWIEKLPRGRPIAVYCICGFQVSGRAVTELRQRGYDARALVGGITAWHAIGGATVPLDTSTYEEAP